jgi:hypothetical protein
MLSRIGLSVYSGRPKASESVGRFETMTRVRAVSGASFGVQECTKKTLTEKRGRMG